jgi:hypothetical protein
LSRSFVGALLSALCVGTPVALGAQDTLSLRRARAAYVDLKYDSAVVLTRRAIDAGRLSRSDLASAYELLGFAAASLDSNALALAAFRELITLEPDREPDAVRVSPRITALYSLALGQVLVVRRLRADSATLVAGQRPFPIRFQVSRSARVTARVVGAGLEMLFDSLSLAGDGTAAWRLLRPDGTPVGSGRYDIVIEAVAGRERAQGGITLQVTATAQDTLPHFTALPGNPERPEYERPRKDWSPLGRSVLYMTFGAGLTAALPQRGLASNLPRELLYAGAGGVSLGLVLSLRRPEPRPIQLAIDYNRVVRDLLARNNADIATQNEMLRRQVVMIVVPVP